MPLPPYDPTKLPSGLDRADGLAGRLGTPTPPSAVRVQGPGGSDTQSIEEAPESPEIERGEQATITHEYTMPWGEGLTQIQGIGRGTVFTDSYGNVTRVLSATLKHLAGEASRMRITAEGVSFDTPPDEFDLAPVELGLNIMKHPRYWYALKGTTADQEAKNQMVIRALQDYMENPSFPYRNGIPIKLAQSMDPANISRYNGLDNDGNPTLFSGTDLAKAAALEIIQKFWRNEETPYIVGLQITWSAYYFYPPDIDLGGRVEDPITEADPPVPDYFWYDKDGYPITRYVAELNPQCYSQDGTTTGDLAISWLRKADQLHFNRTWFRLDRIWVGSPVGFWDPELYGAVERPAAPGDYLPFDAAQMPEYLS